MFADASLKVTSTGTLRILLMDFFEYITIGGTFDNDLVPSCLVRLSERSPVVVVGSENAFKEVHKKSQDIVYAWRGVSKEDEQEWDGTQIRTSCWAIPRVKQSD